MASPSETARRVLELARARAATLGATRLVTIDGPGGSGKTTLAAEVVRAAGPEWSAVVVHMDDLYDGWDGLARRGDQLDDLLLPLTRGEPGTYRRYDWHERRFAETVTVDPPALLVLEGVGSAAPAHARLTTVLVWVWAPRELRLSRGLERDGVALAPQWDAWMRDEDALFAREDTRARADVHVDATGDRSAPAGDGHTA